MLSQLKHNLIILFDICYRPFKRYLPQDVFRYGFVGGLNMVLDTVLYFLFYNYVFDKQIVDLYFVAMTPYIAAYVFVFPITFVTGFVLNKYVVFPESYLRGKTQLVRYAVSVCGSFILHYYILKFFVEAAGFWPTFAKIATVGLVTIYSFCVQKFFSFQKTPLNKRLKKLYRQQQAVWDTARRNIADLQGVETKTFDFGDFEVLAQCNPARAVSSGAKLDEEAIKKRPCFLCAENRPAVQESINYLNGKYDILVNPYPILPLHFVIAAKEHTPQTILPRFADMLALAKDLPDFTILYNGAQAGASAPDHFHFQAVGRGQLPIEKDLFNGKLKMVNGKLKNSQLLTLNSQLYLRSCIVIETKDASEAVRLFEENVITLQNVTRFQKRVTFPPADHEEPKMNVFCWYENGTYTVCIFPRETHRPAQYFAEGDDFMMISPGAIDIAGILVVPRREDFDRLTKELIKDVYRQVSKNIDEPQISVGIMNEAEIEFVLDEKTEVVSYQNSKILFNGNLFDELTLSPKEFELKDVTIGKQFHWERKENQRFTGTLKFIVEDEKVTAINILPVEDYLKSVISSEMSAAASLELLKAHAVISRSWLLSQSVVDSQQSIDDYQLTTNDYRLKYYEREAHKNFDVCADDHCQRYQGISRTTTETAVRAVAETRGEVLTADGEICDARFSKSCGGMTEKFENCWADVPHSYLTSVECPYCNTQDKRILAQVLNNYDQETVDFYRWQVSYSQAELSELVKRKSSIDFGNIIDLIPIKRGSSGRIVELKIIGEKRTVTVGKELEIRKWLSASHLYSSAFVVDKTENAFILHGAGWGHGVGLCQIGAAVMAEKGYSYKEILLHYYKNTALTKIYL